MLDFARKYAWFYLNARTKYGIHSPFVYDLVTKVFEDDYVYPEYKLVEDLRLGLLNNRLVTEVEDYGAGGEDNPVYQKKISEIVARTAKPAKWGKLLYRLAKYFEAGEILELGTSMGISTAYIAFGARGCHDRLNCHTIEGAKNLAEMAAINFKTLGLQDDVHVHNGQFRQILPELLESFKSIDFVFIDGDHRKESTLDYFSMLLPRAHNDTLFVFDDIHWSSGMTEAWEEIIEMPEVTVSIDLFYMGLAFIRREQAKEHFLIRF